MSQLRMKTITTNKSAKQSLPSVEEFATVLVSLAIGALMVFLCVGDVVAAIGLLVLLTLVAVACAGVLGIVYMCFNIFHAVRRQK